MEPQEDIARYSHHTPFGQWIPHDIDRHTESTTSGEPLLDIARGGESCPERWPASGSYDEYH